MQAVFADTFYWIALADRRDQSHKLAIELSAQRASSTLITSEEVLTEFLNYCAASSPPTRTAVAKSVQALLASPFVLVLPQTHMTFLAGLELYSAREDKVYCLTDCISMAQMRKTASTRFSLTTATSSKKAFSPFFDN